MPSNYTLTIAGKNHLQRGVHHAAVFNDCIELAFYKNGSLIKQINLSSDPSSLSRSLEATQQKIELICSRLGIEERDLNYERSKLNKFQKIAYKTLFIKKLLLSALIPIQWVIVYKKANDNKWHKLIPDSKVFQADPFVVFNDDKYFIFYEELKFENYHGYLMVAELDLINNRLINEKVILTLDHHLSFPNVFEEDGNFYMIPECADSKCVDLYECTDFPYQWSKKKTLLENISAVDTTPLKTDDGWYLFTSEIIKGAGCNDELSIYKSADLFNAPFTKLYSEPVVSDVTNARMAGHFIKQGSELFRVSQNCGKRYGHQANINKVLQIEGGYKEVLVDTLKPSFGALGLHTYNTYCAHTNSHAQEDALIVADMEIPRFDIHSLKRFTWQNIKKVFLRH